MVAYLDGKVQLHSCMHFNEEMAKINTNYYINVLLLNLQFYGILLAGDIVNSYYYYPESRGRARMCSSVSDLLHHRL